MGGASTDEGAAVTEVVDLCRDLIRFDTSNPGKTERPAAEYVAEKLEEVGLSTTVFEAARGGPASSPGWRVPTRAGTRC
jgi:acetylornithine deacetylase/succinyl-diaminopimelate desuccinylase-like protein